MTSINNINALPTCPYNHTGKLGIVITSGISSYFEVTGVGLTNIKSVNWYPLNPSSLLFTIRQLVLIDDFKATFMVQVDDNLLDITDRGGRISFKLDDGFSISYPVVTYGPVSIMPLWSSPHSGLGIG